MHERVYMCMEERQMGKGEGPLIMIQSKVALLHLLSWQCKGANVHIWTTRRKGRLERVLVLLFAHREQKQMQGSLHTRERGNASWCNNFQGNYTNVITAILEAWWGTSFNSLEIKIPEGFSAHSERVTLDANFLLSKFQSAGNHL